MLTMLAIAVLVPVGVGAVMLALDGWISRPGHPPPSAGTGAPEADTTVERRDQALQPRATYRPLRDRTADPARRARRGS